MSELNVIAANGVKATQAGANLTLSADVGTTAGKVCAADDTRLSNARTPVAHAASHAPTGSDPVPVPAPDGVTIDAGGAGSTLRVIALPDNSVTAAAIADGVITGAKLDGMISISTNNLHVGGTLTADNDVDVGGNISAGLNTISAGTFTGGGVSVNQVLAPYIQFNGGGSSGLGAGNAGVYMDFAGSVHACDTSGNDVIISPHAEDAPAYDDGPGCDEIVREVNRCGDWCAYKWMDRMAKSSDRLALYAPAAYARLSAREKASPSHVALTGDATTDAVNLSRATYYEETIAEYMARIGAVAGQTRYVTALDWDAEEQRRADEVEARRQALSAAQREATATLSNTAGIEATIKVISDPKFTSVERAKACEVLKLVRAAEATMRKVPEAAYVKRARPVWA